MERFGFVGVKVGEREEGGGDFDVEGLMRFASEDGVEEGGDEGAVNL